MKNIDLERIRKALKDSEIVTIDEQLEGRVMSINEDRTTIEIKIQKKGQVD